jgi:hypothetical protein
VLCAMFFTVSPASLASSASESGIEEARPLIRVRGEIQESRRGLEFVPSGIYYEDSELDLPYEEASLPRPYGSRGRLPSLIVKTRVSPANGELMLIMTGKFPEMGPVKANIFEGRYELPSGRLIEGRRFTGHVRIDTPRVVSFDFFYPDDSGDFIFAGAEVTGRITLMSCDYHGVLKEKLGNYSPDRSFHGTELNVIEDMLCVGDDVYLLITRRECESFIGRAYLLVVQAVEFGYTLVRFTDGGGKWLSDKSFSEWQPMPPFDLDSRDPASLLAYEEFGTLRLAEDGSLIVDVWENRGLTRWKADRELENIEKIGEGDPRLVPITRYMEHFNPEDQRR